MHNEEAFFDVDRKYRERNADLLASSVRGTRVLIVLQTMMLVVLLAAAIVLWHGWPASSVAVERPVNIVVAAGESAPAVTVETFQAQQSFVSGSTCLCEPKKALCDLVWIGAANVRMSTPELAKHLETQLESRELVLTVAGGHDLTELSPATAMRLGSNDNLAYLRARQVIEWLTSNAPALERAHVIPIATGSSAPQRHVDRSAWITVLSLPRSK